MNIWDYSNGAEIGSDLESFEYKEIKEQLNTTGQSERETYQFVISDQHAKILYHAGYLHQQLKIVKSNGTSVGEENVTLVNGGGMLRTSTLTIGTSKMDVDINHSSLLVHIMGLVNFTRDYLSSEPTNMLYYPDTADSADRGDFKYDSPTPLTDQTTLTTLFKGLKLNDRQNRGFLKRWQLTKNSRSVDILIPLKYIFAFFNDFKKVITGFEVKMEFQRETNANMLYTDAQNPDYQVTVEKISLWLPYVEFKPAVESKFQQLLNSAYDVTWRQPRIQPSTNQSADRGAYSIPATSDEVYSLIVVPQYVDRRNDFKRNNMVFDHLDMKECWLMVNNVQVPLVRYTSDFQNKKYPRIYEGLLQMGENTIDDMTGCFVDRENFGTLYPMICFDLSKHKSYTDLSNLMIEFNWELKAPPAKEYMFYFVLMEKKRCQLNMAEKRITHLKTLKS